MCEVCVFAYKLSRLIALYLLIKLKIRRIKRDAFSLEEIKIYKKKNRSFLKVCDLFSIIVLMVYGAILIRLDVILLSDMFAWL